MAEISCSGVLLAGARGTIAVSKISLRFRFFRLSARCVESDVNRIVLCRGAQDAAADDLVADAAEGADTARIRHHTLGLPGTLAPVYQVLANRCSVSIEQSARCRVQPA